MSDQILFASIFVASVLISSFSQILLKKSALKKHKSTRREYLNPQVIIAYVLFFGSTLITVYAFKYVPLSMAPVLESLGYVFIGVLSFIFLKERLRIKGVVGMLLIVAGVIICSL